MGGLNFPTAWLALNNRNGFRAFQCFLEHFPYIRLAGLLVHPKEKARFREEILSLCSLPSERIIEWKKGMDLDQFACFWNEFSKSLLLSVNFGYLFPGKFLSRFSMALNLHTGFLPWNRGSHPNVWPFLDGSPAGVTLHEMVEEVDAGRIIFQEKVEIQPDDDAKSLYQKLEDLSPTVLEKGLGGLLEGSAIPFVPSEKGSHHTHRDFRELCTIEMEENFSGAQWIARMKALSFPPFRNAFFFEGGKKIYMEASFFQGEND